MKGYLTLAVLVLSGWSVAAEMYQYIDLDYYDSTEKYTVFYEGTNSVEYGTLVGPAGDINCDGYDDFVIGDPSYLSSGLLLVIFGRETGETYVLTMEMDDWMDELNQGFRIINPDVTDGDLGYSVTSLGDVNGDDCDDMALGLSGFESDTGKVYVMFGKSDWGDEVDLADFQGNGFDGYSITGINLGDYLGWKRGVVAAGDVNNDNIPDLLVAAGEEDTGVDDSGAVYCIFGKSSYVDILLEDWVSNDTMGFKVTGSIAFEYLGDSMASGDLNGDGFTDVILGSPQQDRSGVENIGRIYIIWGKEDGWDTIESSSLVSGTNEVGTVINGTVAEQYFGTTVSSADFNGDDKDDLVVGTADDYESIFVYFGKSDISEAFNHTLEYYNEDYLSSCTSLGDINGDGFADFGCSVDGGRGEKDVDGGYPDDGDLSYFVVFYGSSGMGDSPRYIDDISSEFMIELQQDDDIEDLGIYSSGVGDVNNDGYSEFMITTETEGVAFLVFGASTEEVVFPVEVLLDELPSSDFEVETIYGPANFDDIDGSYFGYYVGALGDINCDSYDDFMITAYYSTTEFPNSTMFVYFGNESGHDYPDFNSSDPANMFVSGVDGFIIYGPSDSSQVGVSIGEVGDFNGDSCDDFIVGGGFTTDRRGVAYVIFGKSSWEDLHLAAFVTSPETGVEIIGIDDSYLAAENAADGAGDFNGDGLMDIIIAAPRYDYSSRIDSGGAWVIFGNDSITESIDLDTFVSGDLGFLIGGAEDGDKIGQCVHSAGDINGDGFSDVLIGSVDLRSDNWTENGGVYIILGKNSTWTDVDLVDVEDGISTDGIFLAGEISWAGLGQYVSGAGDINNDSYSDFIITASNYYDAKASQTRVYLGKANLSEAFEPALIVNGYGTTHNDMIGDFNNDGFDDFMTGSYYLEDFAGVQFVVMGSADFGSPPRTIQYADWNKEFPAFRVVGHPEEEIAEQSSRAGDINNDGYSDIIISTYERESAYVIFGGPVVTESPTVSPTLSPTMSPTAPTASPTHSPTTFPTELPSNSPTSSPTLSPTRSPSVSPTLAPTLVPSVSPSASPSQAPEDIGLVTGETTTETTPMTPTIIGVVVGAVVAFGVGIVLFSRRKRRAQHTADDGVIVYSYDQTKSKRTIETIIQTK